MQPMNTQLDTQQSWAGVLEIGNFKMVSLVGVCVCLRSDVNVQNGITGWSVCLRML